MIWRDFLLILAGGAGGAFLLGLLVCLVAMRQPVRIGFDVIKHRDD